MLRTRNVDFYLNGAAEHSGSAVVSFDDRHPFRPSGYVCVCPSCGNAWAKAKVSGQISQRYHACSVPCSEHGGGLIVDTATYLCVKSKFSVEYDQRVWENDFVVLYDKWLLPGIGCPSQLESIEELGFPINAGSRLSGLEITK